MKYRAFLHPSPNNHHSQTFLPQSIVLQHSVFQACSNMATTRNVDAAPASDIAQLWERAVEDYEKQTKKSLHLAQFSNIDQIMKGTEGLSNNFKDFRHDRSKTDNVRTALKNNLWLIQKVVNTVQAVGNAASVCSRTWSDERGCR